MEFEGVALAKWQRLGMDALERFYRRYLLDYADCGNFAEYDLDIQLTRDKVEKILQAGYLKDEDIEFLDLIIPDIENQRIRLDLEDFLQEAKRLRRIGNGV
jgi:hypothetical protein